MRAKAQKEELLALINTHAPADIDQVDADINDIKVSIIAAVSMAVMSMKHGDGIAATKAFAFAEAAEAVATKAAETVATKAAATKTAEAATTTASTEANATI